MWTAVVHDHGRRTGSRVPQLQGGCPTCVLDVDHRVNLGEGVWETSQSIPVRAARCHDVMVVANQQLVWAAWRCVCGDDGDCAGQQLQGALPCVLSVEAWLRTAFGCTIGDTQSPDFGHFLTSTFGTILEHVGW